MKLFLIASLGLLLTASRQPATQGSEGALGRIRYILPNTALHAQSPSSALYSLAPGYAEFLAPLNDFSELDRLAALSHSATNLCGSIDYFPRGYALATTQEHTPPYFAPEAQFSDLTSLSSEISLDRMNQTLTTLTSLPTRFHRNATGQNAGTTVEALWKAEQTSSDWTTAQITHSATPQKSVIATLPGESSATVVLGAHLDSINASAGVDGSAPGADDDGSGIAILTEILHIIEAKGLRFHRTIELHGYAAEEIGLVGSRAIASSYRTAGRSIAGMMQFDMAYFSQSADLGKLFFLEDYTSLDLFRNSIGWTKRYIGSVYTRGVLPKGSASDHKAWWEQGYPTVFPFENPNADNSYIHSANDTMDKFDDGVRMQRMVQLGLIFLAYQAGLKSLDETAASEAERLRKEDVGKDLFLSLTGTGGTYTFRASAPSDSTYLELCRIESASDFRCAGARQKLSASDALNGRAMFSGELTLSAGETYRLEAYDAADSLLARRHIALKTAP